MIIFQINESNSIEILGKYSNLNAIPLSDQTKFRRTEINKIKNYFNSEIQERKTMSKKLIKYIVAFDYFDKTLIVLSVTSGGISIIYFTSIIAVSVGISSASFSLIFSLTAGIIKKLLKITKNKKKKHNKIIMFAKSKLNSIGTLISQALIHLEISHEEFRTIVNEKEKHEQMKESIGNTKSNDEKDESNENSKNIKENSENV